MLDSKRYLEKRQKLIKEDFEYASSWQTFDEELSQEERALVVWWPAFKHTIACQAATLNHRARTIVAASQKPRGVRVAPPCRLWHTLLRSPCRTLHAL